MDIYQTKCCNVCNTLKIISEFHKASSNKDGYSNRCKECKAISDKNYREQNQEKISEKKKIYYNNNIQKHKEQRTTYRKNNRDLILEQKKKYYQENKENISSRKKQYREQNREEILEKEKQKRDNNRDKRKQYARKYREKNKERLREKDKEYYINNKEKYKEYQENAKTNRNNKRRERWRTDPFYALIESIRTRIGESFRKNGYTKSSRTYEIIGCSFEELYLHIESQFKDGMNWENRGKWHVDHIIPLASATTEEEIIKLNHYTNLQPLWAIDNLKKGSKF